MAFQAGTRVDPRLMQADYSGFARAGEIEGQAMANIGQSVASGIEGYKKKKKEEKIGQAKINRSIAFGESMIEMLGEDHPLSDSIADSLAMNFGANVPFDQAVAATDGLSDSITNMFLMSQQSQPPTVTNLPGGGQVVNVGGKNQVITPYQMGMGSNPYEDLIRSIDGGTTPVTPPPALTPEELEEEARLMRQAQLNQ